MKKMIFSIILFLSISILVASNDVNNRSNDSNYNQNITVVVHITTENLKTATSKTEPATNPITLLKAAAVSRVKPAIAKPKIVITTPKATTAKPKQPVPNKPVTSKPKIATTSSRTTTVKANTVITTPKTAIVKPHNQPAPSKLQKKPNLFSGSNLLSGVQLKQSRLNKITFGSCNAGCIKKRF
jgi:hypothetical protein